MKMKFVKTFSDVPLGQPLLYIDSRGHLALAVNQKNFAAIYGIKPPVALFIPRAGSKALTAVAVRRASPSRDSRRRLVAT